MAKRSRKSVGIRRWRRWSEDEARSALAELAGSGESAVRFARRLGISTQRLAYWRKRLGTTSAAFVAVRLPTTTSARHIEIALDGVAVRVREDLDVEHVARLVEALARRARSC
jgi:transposase-like protein